MQNSSISVRPDSPRMCGGQPKMRKEGQPYKKFSPHVRGSTLCRAFIGVPFKIHPACAGINQRVEQSGTKVEHSSRMRGGQPNVLTMLGS